MAIRQWFAPGRVNLIGEHLDYNGGPVLPIAIDHGVTVKARQRDDSQVRVWTSLDHAHGEFTHGEFDTSVAPGGVDGWLAYVAGVFWALADGGHRVPGFDLVIDSDLPAGAGLGSSAALECAVASAVSDTCGLNFSTADLAALVWRAETEFVGVPCGPMDHFVSLGATAGHAQLIEGVPEVDGTRVQNVSADWAADGLALMVIDTGVRRSLTDDRYAVRRAECAEAAQSLGLTALAAAGPDAVLRLDDEALKSRTRHVITETARTRGAIRAMRSRNWKQFGSILTASHESLRDDFGVSCMELDIAAETAAGAGALGARMTGAGFGGCAIALVPEEQIRAITNKLETVFAHAGRAAPACRVVQPAAGCREIT